MFQWEISAVGATEDDGTPNEAVATLMIEHGEQACALAVCEIDGVLFSVYLDATWDADLVDSKLKRLGIPPLRIILQPLDKRRHGKLSRGGTDIVTMHAGEPGEPGQPLE
jgi:hypothetical protein